MVRGSSGAQSTRRAMRMIWQPPLQQAQGTPHGARREPRRDYADVMRGQQEQYMKRPCASVRLQQARRSAARGSHRERTVALRAGTRTRG